jgi:hypothetical protein
MSDQFPPVPPSISFPVPPAAPAGDKRGLAIAALILGIISLCAGLVPCCGAITSIVGLVLGIMGRRSTAKNLAVAGIILSIIGLVVTIVSAILGAIYGPALLEQYQYQVPQFIQP